jgi:transcription elongation factor Elf1
MGDDSANKAKSAALKVKITLDANEMPLTEALKQVLEQTKIPYAIEDTPSDAKVTMTLKNVSASDALDLLTRGAGIGWVYKRDGKDEKVSVGKKYAGHRVVFNTVSGDTIRAPYFDDAAVQRQVQEAMRQAQRATQLASRTYTFSMFPARLPDTRVKLDVRNGNLRDILKDVLKQARLDYALDNDVPEDQKRSFTFENVPIATALDVITRSADIGWRAERQPTKEGDKDKTSKPEEATDEGKILILIGKKYARPGTADMEDFQFQPLAPNVWTPKATTSLYNVKRVEQRSTFTCPHCHQRTTIVRRDGEDRAWKFCPLCGKPVDIQANVKSAPTTQVEPELMDSLLENQSSLNDVQDQLIRLSSIAGPDSDVELEESSESSDEETVAPQPSVCATVPMD